MDFRVLQGVSRAALADRDYQDQQEQLQRDERRRTRSGFQSYLEKVAEHPLMPEGAKTVAMQALIDTAMKGDKSDDKHFQRWSDQLWRSTLRPSPMTQPERTTQNLSAAPALDTGVEATAPGFGGAFADFISGQAGKIPTGNQRQQIGGMYSQQEVDDREEERLRRKLSVTREYDKPSYIELNANTRLYSPQQDRVVAEGPPAAARLPSEQDKDYERALMLYSSENNIDINKVRSDPRLAADAERLYADRTGRTPKPLSPYMLSEPMVPVWDDESGQAIYMPRSQAKGRPAPRTVFDERGFPSVGQSPGKSLVPPPNIPEVTQAIFRGFDVVDAQLDGAEPLINAVRTSPIWGRIAKLQVRAIGGAGTTPGEKELVVRLRRLLSSQAFAEGGKQLTGTERDEFVAITPAPEDTVEQAIIKLGLLREFIKIKRAAAMKYLPPRTKAQIDPNAARLNSGAATHRYVPGKGAVPIGGQP